LKNQNQLYYSDFVLIHVTLDKICIFLKSRYILMSPFNNNRVCAPILWQITTSFIFVNDAKIVLILNLELEKITEVSYNDAYDKVF
jgi:glutathionyl-hydroquinone reductase